MFQGTDHACCRTTCCNCRNNTIHSMTTDSQQAVALSEKEQKAAKKLKKLQAKLDGSTTVSDADQAAVAKLQKKLKKLRKQVAEAQQQTGVSTAPSTDSEDSAVAIPADSEQQKAKKSKKRAGRWYDSTACSVLCFLVRQVCRELSGLHYCSWACINAAPITSCQVAGQWVSLAGHSQANLRSTWPLSATLPWVYSPYRNAIDRCRRLSPSGDSC